MAKAAKHQFCTSIIKSCDHNFTYSVGSSSLNHSEAGLKVKTGVCQGCVMSAVLFNLVIDRVTRHNRNQPKGITWTLFDTLEDLDFTDDLALLFHMHQLIQEKTCRLSKFGQKVALQISKRKTEVMTLNVNAQHQSCLTTRLFPAQRPLPIWAALSDRMEAPMGILTAD